MGSGFKMSVYVCAITISSMRQITPHKTIMKYVDGNVHVFQKTM